MVLFKLYIGRDFQLRYRNLHSTMVLFKLLDAAIQLLQSLFTFHYGPIQIIVTKKFRTTSKRFTFHYGPIQMANFH